MKMAKSDVKLCGHGKMFYITNLINPQIRLKTMGPGGEGVGPGGARGGARQNLNKGPLKRVLFRNHFNFLVNY